MHTRPRPLMTPRRQRLRRRCQRSRPLLTAAPSSSQAQSSTRWVCFICFTDIFLCLRRLYPRHMIVHKSWHSRVPCLESVLECSMPDKTAHTTHKPQKHTNTQTRADPGADSRHRQRRARGTADARHRVLLPQCAVDRARGEFSTVSLEDLCALLCVCAVCLCV